MAEKSGSIEYAEKENIMDTQKVVFVNKELGLRLAGLLRLPEGFDLKRNDA